MNLYDLFFDGILKHIRENNVRIIETRYCKKIIDLGCGTGSQCQLLVKKGYEVVGIDKTERMIHNAKKKQIDNAAFILNDITKNSFKSNIFDCAIITLVLHPNNQQTISKIINEAKRMVKKQGIIIITDYDYGLSIKGKIAISIIRILESFTQPSHRINYFNFMKSGGLKKYLFKRRENVIQSKDFFNGAIKTIVLHPE